MQRFTLNALRGLAALALIHGAAAAQAAGSPAKPIVFIVPYTAGGTTDLVARTAGAKVAEKLGQPVIVENRPGAGGNIGMDAVAKAAPDGYTIGFGAISTNALNPFVYPSMPFDPTKDFTGISAPFEAPKHPALDIDTSQLPLEVSVGRVVELIERRPLPPAPPEGGE